MGGFYPAFSGLVVTARNSGNNWQVGKVIGMLESAELDEETVEMVKRGCSPWDVAAYIEGLNVDWGQPWAERVLVALEPHGFAVTEEDRWLIEEETEKDES